MYIAVDPVPLERDALWKEWDAKKAVWLKDGNMKALVSFSRCDSESLAEYSFWQGASHRDHVPQFLYGIGGGESINKIRLRITSMKCLRNVGDVHTRAIKARARCVAANP